MEVPSTRGAVPDRAVTIRIAEERDAAAMTDLLNAVIAAGDLTIMRGPITEREQAAYVRHFPDAGSFLVAECARTGRLLGMQSVEPVALGGPATRHVGDVSTFVALDARRRGIGAKLLAATLDAARARGCLKLMAMIRAENQGAVAFYTRSGFRLIGTLERHAEIDGGWVDEVLTEMLL